MQRKFRTSLANSLFGDRNGGGGASSGSDGDAGELRSAHHGRPPDYWEMSRVQRIEAGLTSPPRQAPESDDDASAGADSDDGSVLANKMRAARRVKISLKRKHEAASRLHRPADGSDIPRPRKQKRPAPTANPPGSAAAPAAAAGGSRASPPVVTPVSTPLPVQGFTLPVEHDDGQPVEPVSSSSSSSAAAAAAPKPAPTLRQMLNVASQPPQVAASSIPVQQGPRASMPARQLSAAERMLYELNTDQKEASAAAAAANSLSADAAAANMALTFSEGGESAPEFVSHSRISEVYDSSDPVVRARQKKDDEKCFYCICERAGQVEQNPGFAQLTREFVRNRHKPLEVQGDHLQQFYRETFKGVALKYVWPTDCILRHFIKHSPPHETVLPQFAETINQALLSMKQKGIWRKDPRGGDPLVDSANFKLFLAGIKAWRELSR